MNRITINNKAPTSNIEDPEKQAQDVPDDTSFHLSIDASHRGESLTIEQYRTLVGMPQERPLKPPNQSSDGFLKTQHGLISLSNLKDLQNNHNQSTRIYPATYNKDGFASHGSRFMVATHLFSRPAAMREGIFGRRKGSSQEANEYATSLYFTLVRLESDQHRLAHFYNIITYFCLVAQLVIASVLVILGAIFTDGAANHHIAIAVLGAVTGVLTGLLSLLKGQGYPTRMVRYADRLREVRDKMEFMERALRANCGAIVTFQDVLNLWNEFEKVRDEQALNRPDVWANSIQVQQAFNKGLQQPRQLLEGQGFFGTSPSAAGAKNQTSTPAQPAGPSFTHRERAAADQRQQPSNTEAGAKTDPTRGSTMPIWNATRMEAQPAVQG